MTSTVLVTGATGAIGTPLVSSLLDAGWNVRVLARHPERIDAHWRDRVDVVVGDISDPSVLDEALSGCQVAYYLVHSMSAEHDFVSRDRELATSFAERMRLPASFSSKRCTMCSTSGGTVRPGTRSDIFGAGFASCCPIRLTFESPAKGRTPAIISNNITPSA